MNILLTGATGFLGNNFLQYFKKAKIADHLILLSSRQIEGFDCVLHKGYTFTEEDFRLACVNQIDAVILLGAYVEHGKEPEMVRKHLSSINNLDYLLQHLPNVPSKIVYCSSVAVYGFNQSQPYTPDKSRIFSEQSALNPVRVYALSKSMGEKLVAEWGKEHGCSSQIIRIGSGYGKGNIKNFLTYIMDCARSGKEFTLTTSPERLFNFVYAEDIARWLLNAVYLKESPGVINLTSSSNYTAIEILQIVQKICPSFTFKIDANGSSCGMDQIFDSSKREKYLGNELWMLEEGLREVLQS